MARVRRVPGPAGQPLKAALAGLNGLEGKVGWFKSAVYPDGTPTALVAAVQEYGWPEHNIPPRLGMRATAAEKQGEWGQWAEGVSKQVLAGSMTGYTAMDSLGGKAAGDLRKHIANVTSPPLKPDTVKARLRGRDQGNVVSITIAKPLVHTGYLLNSLTHVTEKA